MHASDSPQSTISPFSLPLFFTMRETTQWLVRADFSFRFSRIAISNLPGLNQEKGETTTKNCHDFL